MADDGTVDTLDTGGSDAPVDDLRADIEQAFDQVETRDATPAPDKGAPASPPAGSPGERVRGPDGRFAPGDAPRPAPAPTGAPGEPGKTLGVKPALTPQQRAPGQAPGAPAPGGDPAAPSLRPPVSWKPGAREHWAKLPPDVQQEVVRRETETARVLQDSARAREALTHVQREIAPYAANVQAGGGDVITTIGNFFKADNTLRHGTTVDKATMVADIIKNYGVDLVALDGILAGQQVAPDPNEAMASRLRAEMRRELQPVMQYFNQIQGRRQEAMGEIQQSAGADVTNFGADEAHEFFEDVRVDMADIIDMATARNQPITLQQAYDRAILMNPQIAEVVQRRVDAARVNTQAQAAQRARRAAASISGSPAPAGRPGASGDDRRAAIEAAWDANDGG